jgi:hypothetical protein
MNRRGSILGYTAVSMAALVGIAGFAVDLRACGSSRRG